MKTSEWFFSICYLTYCSFIGLSRGESLRGNNVRDAKKEHKLSFTVSIGRVGRPIGHFCTGTLISLQSVLTSAHCLIGEHFDSIEVTAGSADLRLGKKYRVESWKTYDQWFYNTTDFYESPDDLAIIKLAEKVKHCKIEPASILTFPVEDLHRSKVRIAGWGISEDGTVPMILKTAVLNVISLEDCVRKAEKLTGLKYKIPKDYFCSSADPWVMTSCGDSGAPVLNKNNQLVAINKGACPHLDDHPKEFADRNLMNLHLHLFRYREFIDKVKV